MQLIAAGATTSFAKTGAAADIDYGGQGLTNIASISFTDDTTQTTAALTSTTDSETYDGRNILAYGYGTGTVESFTISDYAGIVDALIDAILTLAPEGGRLELPGGSWPGGKQLTLGPGYHGMVAETQLTIAGQGGLGNPNTTYDFGTTIDASGMGNPAIVLDGDSGILRGIRFENLRILGDGTGTAIKQGPNVSFGPFCGFDRVSIQQFDTALDTDTWFYTANGAILIGHCNQAWRHTGAWNGNGEVEVHIAHISNPPDRPAIHFNQIRGGRITGTWQIVDNQAFRLDRGRAAAIGPVYTEQLNGAGAAGDIVFELRDFNASTFGPVKSGLNTEGTIKLGDQAAGTTAGYRSRIINIDGAQTNLIADAAGHSWKVEDSYLLDVDLSAFNVGMLLNNGIRGAYNPPSKEFRFDFDEVAIDGLN